MENLHSSSENIANKASEDIEEDLVMLFEKYAEKRLC
jgi:hypothetical protein